jgi:hypothetical protein
LRLLYRERCTAFCLTAGQPVFEVVVSGEVYGFLPDSRQGCFKAGQPVSKVLVSGVEYGFLPDRSGESESVSHLYKRQVESKHFGIASKGKRTHCLLYWRL